VNKKAVLLPIVVLLAALMIGSAMGAPVKAYDDNCGPPSCDDQAVSPPCQPPVHYEISGPFSISCPGRVWQAGNTIHMRGLELVGHFVMCDSAGNELPGVAILNVNSDVNVKKCQANVRVHIILDTDYGWWEGDMTLKARWVQGDQLGVGTGRCLLYGHGAWDCWSIYLNIAAYNNDFDFNGKMWNPEEREWCQIV
jgi:hypothetical protein